MLRDENFTWQQQARDNFSSHTLLYLRIYHSWPMQCIQGLVYSLQISRNSKYSSNQIQKHPTGKNLVKFSN